MLKNLGAHGGIEAGIRFRDGRDVGDDVQHREIPRAGLESCAITGTVIPCKVMANVVEVRAELSELLFATSGIEDSGSRG